MRAGSVVVVFFACVAVGAAPTAAPKELIALAKSAAGSEQYCRSRDLYLEVFRRDPQAKYLYNAAEVALAADDRASALALYGQLQNDYPRFESIDDVRGRFAELAAALATGPGTICPTVKTTCGDWLTTGGEVCDDGNATDGDGCDHNCIATGCGNGIVTAGEQCDDGNSNDNDGCSHVCTLPTCGNGIVERGEECDEVSAACGACRTVAVVMTPTPPVVTTPTPVVTTPTTPKTKTTPARDDEGEDDEEEEAARKKTNGLSPWLVGGGVVGGIGGVVVLAGLEGFFTGIGAGGDVARLGDTYRADPSVENRDAIVAARADFEPWLPWYAASPYLCGGGCLACGVGTTMLGIGFILPATEDER